MNLESRLSEKPTVLDGSLPVSFNARYDLEVPAGTPVLLNDINGILKPEVRSRTIDQAVRILIGTTFKPETALYATTQTIATSMLELVAPILAQTSPQETAIILPGEGAKAVLRESLQGLPELSLFKSYFVPTERIVDNGKPVDVRVMLTDLDLEFFEKSFRTFIVVDDVVATGKTLNVLREKLTNKSTKRKLFRAVTWFLRQPTQVNGYQSVESIYRYWTREGWPALNSLSTLLRTDEKGESVRAGYIKKYIRYPYGFRKQIDYIRSLTTIGGTP